MKKLSDWFKLGKTSAAAVAPRAALELLHIFDCSLNTYLKHQNLLKGGHIPPAIPFFSSLKGFENVAEAKVLWFCLILYLRVTFFLLVSAGHECYRLTRGGGALCGSQGSEGEQDTPTLSTKPTPPSPFLK